ncbi:MAG: hypothetical protein HZA20_04150 [Nitrospirae bacterium]|nr:hypothetical protein [Nitrospirota bacterium]
MTLRNLSGHTLSVCGVTVRANWRITFRFADGRAEIVNYEDYH